jgi:transcriptional regulator with XRE-family HTH domain
MASRVYPIAMVTTETLPESRREKWTRIRARYESGVMSQRELARLEGVSHSTLMQRAAREKWRPRAKLVQATARKLEAELDERSVSIIRDELAPFIEREKIRLTKRGYRIGSKGLTRVEKLWKNLNPDNPKGEADGARAAETFLRMARTSLGMDDGKAPAGSVNLNILTGQAAVQVTSAPNA